MRTFVNQMLVLSSFLCLWPAYAQEFSSPRATALGGYVAMSDDVFATEWNLAGAALGQRKLEAAFANSDIKTSNKFEDFRIYARLWRRHLIAFSSTPGMRQEHRISKLPFYSEEFDPLYFLAPLGFEEDLGIGYAFEVHSRFAVAAGFKRQNFYNRFTPSRFWSLSLHAFYQFSDKLSFGIVARNIHSFHKRKPINRMGFIQNDSLRVIEVDFESFETVFTRPHRRVDFGIAFRPFTNLLAAMDVFSDGGYGVGLEWQVLPGLFLRNGMSHKHDGLFKLEKVFGVTWGLGVQYQTARLDLAYYFPYGGRDPALELTTFGEFAVDPFKNDKIMFSASFGFC